MFARMPMQFRHQGHSRSCLLHWITASLLIFVDCFLGLGLFLMTPSSVIFKKNEDIFGSKLVMAGPNSNIAIILSLAWWHPPSTALFFIFRGGIQLGAETWGGLDWWPLLQNRTLISSPYEHLELGNWFALCLHGCQCSFVTETNPDLVSCIWMCPLCWCFADWFLGSGLLFLAHL